MNKAMNRQRRPFSLCLQYLAYAIGIIWLSLPVHALDNPDAADRLAFFEAREQPYRQAVQRPANTTLDIIQAYADYEAFLATELQQAYQDMYQHISPAARPALQRAQCRWEAYRDTEMAMIQHTWTRAAFGSSFALSRGEYRISILRTRLVQLMHYANNYPETSPVN